MPGITQILLPNPVILGANACVELNLFEDAIAWCDKGLAVSFVLSLKHKLSVRHRLKSNLILQTNYTSSGPDFLEKIS